MDIVKAKIEKKRKAWVAQNNIFIITFLAYILVTILYTITIKVKVVSYIYTLYIFYIVWLIILILKKGKLKDELTKVLMNDILKEEFENLKYDVETGISEKYFVESEFLKNYTNYYATNYIYGVLENNFEFQMSDISVTKTEKDLKGNKHTYTMFKGIFAVLEKEKINEFSLIIMPDVKNKYMNQIWGNIKKMVGTKDIVRLENVEFERYFEAYSDNQIEARKIITLEFMEKLLMLRKKFDKSVTILYKKNKVYFFASKVNLVSEMKLLYKGVTTENIENTKKIIQDMYEAMKLL